MSAPKTVRWLDLLAFLLQHRFAVTRERIFSHVRGYAGAEESARRTFERDKRDLRELGIEIETVELEAAGDEPATGYRLRPTGLYLPYFELLEETQVSRSSSTLPHIQLSRAELHALDRATRRMADQGDIPLAAAAASARRKLAFDLPLSSGAAERLLTLPIPEAGRVALAVLQRAVASHTGVACRYYTISRDVEEQREIEPYGVFFQWGHWYCVAHARDRQALRLFRVDRMREARLLEGPDARFTVPAEFDIRAWMGRPPWEQGAGPSTNAVVRFRFPISRWIENQRSGRLTRAQGGDGSAEFEFDVRNRAAFLRWLLSFQRDASVLEPGDLAEELVALRRKVAAIYGDAGPQSEEPGAHT